jgi:hypothetical protein
LLTLSGRPVFVANRYASAAWPARTSWSRIAAAAKLGRATRLFCLVRLGAGLRRSQDRLLLRRQRQSPGVTDRVEGEDAVLDPGQAHLGENAPRFARGRQGLAFPDVLQNPVAAQNGYIGQEQFTAFGDDDVDDARFVGLDRGRFHGARMPFVVQEDGTGLRHGGVPRQRRGICPVPDRVGLFDQSAARPHSCHQRP